MRPMTPEQDPTRKGDPINPAHYKTYPVDY